MTDIILKIENLGHSYGKFKVIEDISIDIKSGSLSALIGPNGAGKTTFYNAISGKFPPSKGKIYLNGIDITGLSAEKVVRKGMARSFQITSIFPELTVLENIMIPLIIKHNMGYSVFKRIAKNSKIIQKAYEVLSYVGLENSAEKTVSTMAYGDKRLVEMGIVLSLDPEVILLDEPTAGMNPEETEKMIALIKNLSKKLGKTFFLTEHDMKVVFSLSEKIYVLHQGRLLAEGAPDQIRDNEQVKEAYLGRKKNA